jgi:membrane-associated PAP2 superfamily phosphatase
MKPMSTPPPSMAQRPVAGARPKPVSRASILLFTLAALFTVWAIGTVGYAVGGIGPPLEDRDATGVAALSVAAAAVTIIGAALLVWFTVMVRRGRNWARISATVLLTVGIVVTLADGVRKLTAEPIVVPVFGVLVIALMVQALGLLWRPKTSRDYFDPSRRSAMP